jgi:hypothetical protein
MAGNSNEAEEIVTSVYLGKVFGYRTWLNDVLHLFKPKNTPEIRRLGEYEV